MGCVNLNPDNNTIESPVGVIPADFDWKTVKELNFTVQVNSVSGISDASARIIKIFNSPLLNSGALIASGSAKPSSPYVVKLSLATALQTIYVQETLPTGTSTVKSVDVTATSLNVTFTKSSMITAGAPIMTKAVTVPSVTLATNYDVTLDATSTDQIHGFSNGDANLYGNKYKSYIIKAGVTNTRVNLSGYGEHAILYVAGTYKLSKTISLNNTSIYILNGGKVEGTGFSTGSIAATDVPNVYIAPGGELVLTGSGSFAAGAYTINKGTITSNSRVTFSSGTDLYNEGNINISGGKKNSDAGLYVTNNSEMYNNSNITTDILDFTSNVIMTNDSKGVITSDKYNQTTSTTVTNYGEIAAVTSFTASSSITLNNYCHITANTVSFQGANSTCNFYDGSLFNCQELATNNVTINMFGGSLMLVNNLPTAYNMDIKNPSNTSYAVIICSGSLRELAYSDCDFNGKIEVVNPSISSENSTYFAKYSSSGTIASTSQTQNIPATTCNSGLGQISGGSPTITDVDGDGIPAETDIDDNDANVAFVSYFPAESTWGTYAIEDLWPSMGDYDVNDLVMDFRVSYYTNASNLVTGMKVDYNLRASGSSLILGAAFQLDGVPASTVSSVTGQTLGASGGYFTTSSNGTESGVSLAVIPLFNRQKDLMDYSQYLNTELGKTHYNTPDNAVTIKFNTPIAQSNVVIGKLNFFICASTRGKEIHLPSFAYTTKFDSSLISGISFYPGDVYKYIDGMMWGLMIPKQFSYPIERATINSAYKHFAEWATSGGTAYADWYLQTDGYTNDDYIYTY